MSNILCQVSDCRISRFFEKGEGKDRQVIAVIEMWGNSFQVPLLDVTQKSVFPVLKVGTAFIHARLDEAKKDWFDREKGGSRQYDVTVFSPSFLSDFKVLK